MGMNLIVPAKRSEGLSLGPLAAEAEGQWITEGDVAMLSLSDLGEAWQTSGLSHWAMEGLPGESP